MKNLFLNLALMLFASFAFANNTENNVKLTIEKLVEVSTNKIVSHSCQYGVYNSRGERIGTVVLTNVADNVACGSDTAMGAALDVWNQYH